MSRLHGSIAPTAPMRSGPFDYAAWPGAGRVLRDALVSF